VPQYEGLKIQSILDQFGQHMAFLQHMPIEKELSKLPKQWICNVAYSLIGDPFRQWVLQMVETRNAKMAVERNEMINLHPRVHAAHMASTHVSRKYSFAFDIFPL
jgi:hypothetical protein